MKKEKMYTKKFEDLNGIIDFLNSIDAAACVRDYAHDTLVDRKTSVKRIQKQGA